MNSLIQILYFVSTILFVPVIVALLLLFCWGILELGGILGEFWERRKKAKHWRQIYKRWEEKKGDGKEKQKNIKEEFLKEAVRLPGFLGLFAIRSANTAPPFLNKIASDIEIEVFGKLSQMNLATRLGPMLGLMGTLIPLGPALIGLSSGDLQKLSQNLVIAFSTTVLGLAIGGLFYGIGLVRRKWYSQDMADIEFILHYLEGEE